MKVLTILTSITLISTSSCLFSTDLKCPNEGKIVLLPNTDDCSSYWVCKEGYPILKGCLHGTLFDALKLACVPHATAVCAGKKPLSTTTTQPTTTPTKTTQRTTTQRTTTQITTTSKNTILPPAEYPVDCPPQLGPNDNFLLPNPKDCHTFYHFVYGHPYLQRCPGKLRFNPELKACDYPDNVKCYVKC